MEHRQFDGNNNNELNNQIERNECLPTREMYANAIEE